MSVLIPIISKKENNPEFLKKAIKGEKKVFLLIIMDTTATTKNFGFATSEIGHGNELIEEIKKNLEPENVSVDEALEWGDTNTQIINYAKLKKIGKVVLAKQENEYFKNLVKDLEKNNFEVKII
ncbi:MAG: hypothetical protein HYW50_02430 [Candidatus Diapherotrites archaeon]|nr:hypothetical protein [Candidatus Diapherotrites archaeon]